jgi:hypothetical protein
LRTVVACGREYFTEIASPDVAAEVFAVLDHPQQLASEPRRFKAGHNKFDGS